EAVEPTCHQTGNVEYWYCADCNAVFTDAALTQLTNFKNVIIPALNELVFVEGYEATCHQTGMQDYWYCPECDAVFADAAGTQLTNRKNLVIPASVELVYVAAKDATCTEDGNTEYWYCPECDAIFADAAGIIITNIKNVVVPATGHNYTAVVTEPTCTEGGYTTYTCDCGDVVIGDITDALGHNYESVVTAPTCTEQGYTTHTCTRCGDSYVDSYVDATGHDYTVGDDAWTWNIDGENTTAKLTITCACGDTVVIDAVVESKIEGDKIIYTATVESELLDGVVVADSVEEIKAPILGDLELEDSDKVFGWIVEGGILYIDAKAEGITVEELGALLKATGVFFDANNEAAVSISGAEAYGDKMLVPTGATVTLTAENSKGDKDTATYTIVVIGDVNCNGRIESNDAVLMQQHFLGKYEITDALALDAADVNRNGRIESNDAVLDKVKFVNPEDYKTKLN
ncbi:MAG: dockerin type I repeat-containing protein, partial [Clostridia bacterium]|nr:dockerin type I repeat-containing protein [Clostridia bacterium]